MNWDKALNTLFLRRSAFWVPFLLVWINDTINALQNKWSKYAIQCDFFTSVCVRVFHSCWCCCCYYLYYYYYWITCCLRACLIIVLTSPPVYLLNETTWNFFSLAFSFTLASLTPHINFGYTAIHVVCILAKFERNKAFIKHDLFEKFTIIYNKIHLIFCVVVNFQTIKSWI